MIASNQSFTVPENMHTEVDLIELEFCYKPVLYPTNAPLSPCLPLKNTANTVSLFWTAV